MILSLRALRALDAIGLRDGEVVYAFVGLEGEPSAADRALLDDSEARRASRFVRAADARRYVGAHAALRLFLARTLAVAPETVRYEASKHGKPRLVSSAAPQSVLEFNLSHSGELALVAATRLGPLGVDVERERALADALAIAERYFSKTERDDLRSLPADSRQAAFFRCWTRKEAMIKADGEGLGVPLDSFDVELSPGSPSALRTWRGSVARSAEWSLRGLPAPPGYAAAGAIQSPVSRPTPWRELVSTAPGDPEPR
jgi:4'-phosphopantetheinyl transferase